MSKLVKDISKIVGRGYRDFWFSRKRYVVCKGSRGSKKSKTACFWLLINIMKYPLSNALIVRQTFASLKDSVWADLQWCAEKLGVAHLWNFTKSPLEATYIPTGQKILFRGCDDGGLKITSISVPKGVLNYVLFEEAYQVSYESFCKIDLSIRGELPEGYFFRIMLIFNPWRKNWIYDEFFKEPRENVLAITTTYECNEWIGEETIKLFEEMKERNYRRYLVEGLGEWGIAEGVVFSNYKMVDFDLSELPNKNELVLCNGCDFGYNDPTVFLRSAVDLESRIIYVYEEHWNQFMTPDDMEELLKKNKLDKVTFIADNARPELIAQLNKKGCHLRACKKGKDSVATGINFLLDFEIIIHPSCPKTFEELTLYSYLTDKEGHTTDKFEDCNNHCIDSLRYSCEDVMKPKKKSRVRSW